MAHVDSRDAAGYYPDPCRYPISRFPLAAYMSVALDHLWKWLDKGLVPPRADRILVDRDADNDGSLMALDEIGNVRGGIRNPYIDVPAKNTLFETRARHRPFRMRTPSSPCVTQPPEISCAASRATRPRCLRIDCAPCTGARRSIAPESPNDSRSYAGRLVVTGLQGRDSRRCCGCRLLTAADPGDHADVRGARLPAGCPRRSPPRMFAFHMRQRGRPLRQAEPVPCVSRSAIRSLRPRHCTEDAQCSGASDAAPVDVALRGSAARRDAGHAW